MLVSMAATLFGAGVLTVESTGAVETLRRTFRHLREKPSVVGLFAIVFIGYALIYGVAAGFSVVLSMIPIVGQILLLPYQLFLYALQGYLNLVMLASLIAFYYGKAAPIIPAPADIHEDSTRLSNISPEEAPEEAPPQPESAGPEEAAR